MTRSTSTPTLSRRQRFALWYTARRLMQSTKALVFQARQLKLLSHDFAMLSLLCLAHSTSVHQMRPISNKFLGTLSVEVFPVFLEVCTATSGPERTIQRDVMGSLTEKANGHLRSDRRQNSSNLAHFWGCWDV